MLETQTIIEYAPIIIIVIIFLNKNRIFITPEQLNQALEDKKNSCNLECKEHLITKEELQLETKKLLKEVEDRFLSIIAFREFEKRIDGKFSDWSNRFDKVDESLAHITDLIIKRG